MTTTNDTAPRPRPFFAFGKWRPSLRTGWLLWAVLLTVSVIAVFIMRDQGRHWLSMSEAHAGIRSGIELYQSGEQAEGQRLIARNLREHPAVWEATLAELNLRVFGLPLVRRDLERYLAANSHVPALSDDLAAFRIKTILGSNDHAAPTEDSPREINLWEGRLALSRGDIHTAKTAFDRYWEVVPPRQRATQYDTFVAGLHIEGEDAPTPAEIAHLLLGMGFWEEAFTLCDMNRDETMPLHFFTGLKADLEGDEKTAMKAYRETVQEHPNHRLALLRLNATAS